MSTEHLLGDMGAILDALIGIDNAARQKAENHLGQLVARTPADVLLLLAQIGAQGVGGFQLDHRLLTLILLRRLAFTERFDLAPPSDGVPRATAPFDVVPEPTRARIERIFGAGLEDEMDARLRKGLGVCVAEWVTESERRQRPFESLPEILLRLAASPRPFHRFSPFQLLDAAPTLLSGVGQTVPARKVTELLLGGIHDPSVDVRVEALKATRSVLHDGMAERERAEFGSGLVAAAFEIIPALPAAALEHGLEPMIDIASSFPDLFRDSLQVAVPFLVMCISPPQTLQGHQFSRYPHCEMEFESWCDMANMATEVLYSLVIADPAAAPSWEGGRLVPDVVAALVGRQVAAFAEDGEESRDWIDQTDLDEEDESYPVYSEEMLYRLSIILKSEDVLQAVGQVASSLLRLPDWRAKYCALMAFASIIEGCREPMGHEVRSLLELVSPAATDHHPRVRYGFLFCISKMATGLDDIIQNDYADATIDITMRLLEDPVPRVREAAAAALVNFFEPEDTPSFENKLQPILTGLINAFMKDGPLYIKERTLAAIGTIALHEQLTFLPYYRDIMDLNLRVLSTPTDESQQKLQGRAIECASLVAQAVGKEHFFKDAVPLCQAYLGIQNQVTKPEDRRRAYLSEAWRVIASVIGFDFAPFLQFVLPPVLRSASYVPPQRSTGLIDEPEDAAADAHSDEMQEKEEAFIHLTVYVNEMQAAYAPWLGETMRVTLDAIHSHWSDGVREAACFLVPGLLQVAKDAGVWVSDTSNLEALFRTLINAIPHEDDATGVGQLYQSIGDCLRVLNAPLPEASTSHLARATLQWLHSLYERRRERVAEAANKARRGDYWLWAEAEQDEEAAENDALHCMDVAFGRVVKGNSAALGAMGDIATMTQKVRAAECAW